MSKLTPRLYEFGPFCADVSDRLLRRNGQVVALTPKVFDTLLVLLQNRGHVVGKDELMQRLWPDSVVEEGSLSQNIFLLRKALGEGTADSQYIETLPKRGYRFVADVREVSDETTEPGPEAEIGVVVGKEVGAVVGQEVVGEADGAAVEQNQTAPARPEARRPKLYRYAYAACAVLILAGAFVYFWRSKPAEESGRGTTAGSVAVLPFKTVGAGDESEILGLGMADALIVRLSSLRRPTVLPTSSVFKYRAREDDAITAGRELGVDAVLDGTVQMSGGRARVTAQLIKLEDGEVLWSGKFDERSGNAFSIQDSISERMAESLLQAGVGGDARVRPAKHSRRDPEAYQDYVTGLYFWNKRDRESVAKAIGYFQRTVDKDPSYALAYALLADCYSLSLFNSYDIVPPAEARKRRAEAMGKAFELERELPETHIVAAAIKSEEEGDAEGAERDLRRAIELNPSHATARWRYANLLLAELRLDEALREIRMAQELDPVSARINGRLGYMLMMARRFEEAVKYCRRATELEPDSAVWHMYLGEAYLYEGMYEEAINEFHKLGERGRMTSVQERAYAYARWGKRDEALRLLAELQSQPDGRPVPAYNLAVIYGALGEMDEAFAWLEKVTPAPSYRPLLMYGPELDPLRSDPRFADQRRRHRLGAD